MPLAQWTRLYRVKGGGRRDIILSVDKFRKRTPQDYHYTIVTNDRKMEIVDSRSPGVILTQPDGITDFGGFRGLAIGEKSKAREISRRLLARGQLNGSERIRTDPPRRRGGGNASRGWRRVMGLGNSFGGGMLAKRYLGGWGAGAYMCWRITVWSNAFVKFEEGVSWARDTARSVETLLDSYDSTKELIVDNLEIILFVLACCLLCYYAVQ